MDINELVAWCDEKLRVTEFEDYCPNGLQVEASESVRLLVSGVTASQALIDAAVERGADTLLVHHGYFWKGESLPLTGLKGQRVKALMRNGISLLAYHLPLDAHPELGNNAGLGRALGLAGRSIVDGSLIWGAELATPVAPEAVAAQLQAALGRSPLQLGPSRPIRRLAWCTGAAQGYIVDAARAGYDGFISGEVSEQTYHQAHELGISYFSAGHHATERFGVQALGDLIANHFGISHEYVELKNPA